MCRKPRSFIALGLASIPAGCWASGYGSAVDATRVVSVKANESGAEAIAT